MTRRNPSLAHTSLAALSVFAASSFVAFGAAATTILSPVAQPFVTGSSLQITGQSIAGAGAPSQHYLENITVQSDSFNNVTGVETIVLGATDASVDTLTGGTTVSDALPGTVTFTLAGRSGMNQTGTFAETLTGYSFTGTNSLGNVINASLTPGQPATGSVTIAADSGGGFDITNSFTIPNQITVDGGPALVATPGTATSAPIGFVLPTTPVAVPEPATFALLGLSLAGLGFVRRRSI